MTASMTKSTDENKKKEKHIFSVASWTISPGRIRPILEAFEKKKKKKKKKLPSKRFVQHEQACFMCPGGNHLQRAPNSIKKQKKQGGGQQVTRGPRTSWNPPGKSFFKSSHECFQLIMLFGGLTIVSQKTPINTTAWQGWSIETDFGQKKELASNISNCRASTTWTQFRISSTYNILQQAQQNSTPQPTRRRSRW